MTSRFWKTAAVAVCLAGLTSAIVIGIRPRHPAPPSEAAQRPPATREEAAGRVTGAAPQALGRGQVDSAFPGASRFVDSATGDAFWFRDDSNVVISFISGRLDEPGGAPSGEVDRAAIEASADALLRRCYVGPDSDIPHMRREVNTNGYNEISIYYRLYRGDIDLPSTLSATYDAHTGELMSFVQFSRPVEISLTPSLDKKEAILVAADKLRMDADEFEGAHLSVFAPAGGTQRLMWVVPVRDAGNGADASRAKRVIAIDANDGTVLMQMRSMQADAVPLGTPS